MTSNNQYWRMEDKIRKLKHSVYVLEQEVVEKDIENNGLVTRNGHLESIYDANKEYNERTAEIYVNIVRHLQRSAEVEDQLRAKIKKLEAEKKEEENQKLHETQSRQNLERNAKQKFMRRGEKIIGKILQDNMAVPPPPHILEKITAEIHQAFSPIQLVPKVVFDVRNVQDQMVRKPVGSANPAPSSSQVSSVNIS